jgi:alpha-galactosidase
MTDPILDQVNITAASIQATKVGLLLSGARVSMELPARPSRYLYSGWQSWSLTAWVETDRPVRPMRPSSLHPLQTDPAYARETRPNGSWYGAVEFPDGQVLFLGALGLESHVRLDGGQTLTGWYEEGQGKWFVGHGNEAEIFDQYARLLKRRYGTGRLQKSPRVWCSWYSLYTGIHEAQLLKILQDLGDLPFDVFQVDDGWQIAVGDWEPNAKFPSGMQALAAHIQATGRKAGLWLAPLLVVPSSSLYHDHPDWLLHDESGRLVSAGLNWGKQLYALDTTHPGALDWLRALMKKVRLWGYDYAKLDFLYAGALPGKRHVDMPREAAYRDGLKVIREALRDAYFLTCGAPVLPSLGLCDGLRVGPDVAGYWTSHMDDDLLMNSATPGTRNALRTTLNRLWLKPLVHTNPDVAYFRTRQNNLSPEQKVLLQDLAQIADFKATSDVPAWLTESEQVALREFLENRPGIQKMGWTSYELDGRPVDFSAHISLPSLPGPFTNMMGAVVAGLANVPALMKIFDAINHRSLRKMLKENPV